MAPARARRKSLADLIDLNDLDTAVEDLLGMNESEFTRAVLYYLEGDRLGMDAMRDPDVIERTYDTIDRLLHVDRQAYRDATHPEQRQRLARMIQSLDIERKAIKEEAKAERQARIRETEGERQAEYAERAAARIEAAAARQRAAREELERVQRKGVEARALAELKRRHLDEFLAIRRALKAQDAAQDAAAEQAREDGAGAADPPEGGAAAPAVPAQAARS